MGEPISILVDPVDVADRFPSKDEIEWDVRHIHPNWARVPSGIRVYYLNIRLAAAQAEENLILIGGGFPWRK